MWLDANDEEKSRLLLDTAYELRISLAGLGTISLRDF